MGRVLIHPRSNNENYPSRKKDKDAESITKKTNSRKHINNQNSHRGRKNFKKTSHQQQGFINVAPPNVHSGDWKEMLLLTMNHQVAIQFTRRQSQLSSSRESYRRKSSTIKSITGNWILDTFKKRECAYFIPTNRDPEKCGCGKLKSQHSVKAKANGRLQPHEGGSSRWLISQHTISTSTDAFGTIEFLGSPHAHKAQYMRVAFDTKPDDIITLMEEVWQVPPPKLVITVHGGILDFDLEPKLARIFRKGLLKAAKTTDAWIITSGINSGVVRHVASALENALIGSMKSQVRITSIGIAPWGMVKRNENFIGENKTVIYHPQPFSSRNKFAVLNNRHSYFLLVDNGTTGRYGADVVLRRQLEGFIVQKQKIDGSERSVPVVCVVLEGGISTIRTVLDYVKNSPKIPVVICDGSGRASNLLAFAHQHIGEDGTLPEEIQSQLLTQIKTIFDENQVDAQCLLYDIIACVKEKHLTTILRLDEEDENQEDETTTLAASNTQNVDHAILTALLKGYNLKPAEQLSLALAWNRVDLARTDIFVLGQEWPTKTLHDAMLQALIHNRVDFVRLLLENGVFMKKFLTIEILEQLYNNTEHSNILFYIIRDIAKIKSTYQYTLPHIGKVLEKLMGYGYRSYYTGSMFRKTYLEDKQKRIIKMRRNSMNGRNQNINSDYFAGPLSVIASSFGINPVITPPATIQNTIASASGNRGLTNHLLWRFRQENSNSFPSTPITPPMTPDVNHEPFGFSRSKKENEDETLSTHNNNKEEKIDTDLFYFLYPFHDLLLWAILTQRYEMALCMWEHGEEALAKSLFACRVYRSLAFEASKDYLEVEICEKLKKCSEEFRQISRELLDACYKQNDARTLQLLTYETRFGKETCLSLAVKANHKAFLAHPCCQMLLADLWHGGLKMRNNSNLKVILALLCPPTIFLLEFKTRKELSKQAQTAAEHEMVINDSDNSENESDLVYSSEESEPEDITMANRQRNRGLSIKSVISIFSSKRKKHNVTLKLPNQDPRPHASSISTPGYLVSPIHKNIRSSSFNDEAAAANIFHTSRRLSIFPGRKSMVQANNGFNDPQMAALYAKRKSIAQTHKEFEKRLGIINSPIRRSLIKATSKPKREVFKKFYKKNEISFHRKLYEFYVAPIASFWSWVLSYIVFLLILIYVLLVRTPRKPTIPEYFLYIYVLTFGIELVRKLIMSEPKRLKEKFGHFFLCNFWNMFTAAAIISFFIGVVIRIWINIGYGRCVIAVSSTLWSIKLLDYFSAHPKFGPLVTMTGEMILAMMHVVIMLIVSLFAFGLARESITFPSEEWNWLMVRNIFYKPYFMVYGEVYAHDIDTCLDKIWEEHMSDGISIAQHLRNTSDISGCVPGYWIPSVLLALFMVVTFLCLTNVFIALFNGIFAEQYQIAKHLWLFQRFSQVMEYESTPVIPPPFTFIYYIYILLKFGYYIIMKKCFKKKNIRKPLIDFSLRLFLEPDEIEKLHDFEEECVEDYWRKKTLEKNDTKEERLNQSVEKTNVLIQKLNDLFSEEYLLESNITNLDSRLNKIEMRDNEILKHFQSITSMLNLIKKQK